MPYLLETFDLPRFPPFNRKFVAILAKAPQELR